MGCCCCCQISRMLREAEVRQLREDRVKLYGGPRVQADGSLQVDFVERFWQFSPAFPAYLESLLSQQDYWSVLVPCNNLMDQAKAVSGVNPATGKLEWGGDGAAALIERVKARDGARDAGLENVRRVLFEANRTFAAKGIAITWNLQVYEWQTQSHTPATPGQPGTGGTTTHHHKRWYIELKPAAGASALPPDVMEREARAREVVLRNVLLMEQPAGAAGAPASGAGATGGAPVAPPAGAVFGSTPAPGAVNPAYGLTRPAAPPATSSAAGSGGPADTKI